MKRTIKLNESDLVRIVEGTARRMLNELDWKTYANATRKAKERQDIGENEYMNMARNAYRRYSGKKPGTFPEEEERRKYEDMISRENYRAAGFSQAAAEAFNRDHLQGKPDDEYYWPSGYGFSRRYDNEPYNIHADSDLRGNHTVQARVNPYEDEYYAGLSSNPVSIDGKPISYTGEERYDWTPVDGLTGTNTYGDRESERYSVGESNMEDSYHGTPEYDRFNRVRNEMEDYLDDRYRYDKGKGWKRGPAY